MKWTIPFLAVVCVTLAMPKKERAFSLFSVVTFPNDQCETQEKTTPMTVGICQTADECTGSGGRKSGNCASGFGACCHHTISIAGGETGKVTKNLTYIQNTGYPTTTGTKAAAGSTATNGKAYKYTVTGGKSICQVRLDFDDVELTAPSSTGTTIGSCSGTALDQLTVTSPSTKLTETMELCGKLTGQHMYIYNDGAETAATITITLGSGTTGRKWKIKVTEIECDSTFCAPAGCLQYYTGSTGTITSFNYDSSATATNQMLLSQEYSACIRTEAGMCSFSVTPARLGTTTPDAFYLAGKTASPVTTSLASADCADEFAYIVIPNTRVAIPRYCGGQLAPTASATASSPVISNVKPFRIGVVSYLPTISTKVDGFTQATAGFQLNYRQIPC